MTRLQCTLNSAEATRSLGEILGRHCRGGEFIALSGPLGSGKTCFTQGLAHGLQVPPDQPVTSPTFVLQRTYAGRLLLHHFDAYRLSGPDEFLDLGIGELAGDPAAVVVVEWPERVAEALPPNRWQLSLAHQPDAPHSRACRLTLPAEVAAALRPRLTTLPE